MDKHVAALGLTRSSLHNRRDGKEVNLSLGAHLYRPRSATRTKATVSKPLVRAAIALTPPVLACVLLVLLLSFSITDAPGTDGKTMFGCDPNGQPWVMWPKPTVWNSDFIFTITLGSGNFAYSTAKLIDICWDLIVGRGAQAVGGIAIYYVFRGRVAELMGRRPTPYKTALAMQYSTVSGSSLMTYARHIRGCWKKQKAVLFNLMVPLTFSTAYVLTLPTLLSAMTGYQAKTKPVLAWDNNTFVSFTDLTMCEFIVPEGDRIGLSSNACIPDDYGPLANAFDTFYMTASLLWGPTKDETFSCWATPGANFSYHGHTFHLESPLKILTGQRILYLYDGRIGSGQDLLDSGMCQPQKTYQWGFSFILTFTFLLLTIFVSVWLSTLYYRRPSSDQTETIFGTFRIPLAVAARVREELGDRVEGMPEREISKALREETSRHHTLSTSCTSRSNLAVPTVDADYEEFEVLSKPHSAEVVTAPAIDEILLKRLSSR